MNNEVHLDEEKGGLVQENKIMMFSSDEMDDEPVASVTQIKVTESGLLELGLKLLVKKVFKKRMLMDAS